MILSHFTFSFPKFQFLLGFPSGCFTHSRLHDEPMSLSLLNLTILATLVELCKSEHSSLCNTHHSPFTSLVITVFNDMLKLAVKIPPSLYSNTINNYQKIWIEHLQKMPKDGVPQLPSI
jgi:hypothetical protein